MPACTSVLQMIGNTPLLELRSFDTGPCRLFVKLENQNPGGSIKDRIARSMIEAAERDGRIGPGTTLVEATAGNTGLGLALIAAQKGYRLILVIPDKMSREKVLHLKALGTEVVMTRSDVCRGHPQYFKTWPSNSPSGRRTPFSSTSSTTRRILWRMKSPPARRFGTKPATSWTRSSAESVPAERLRASAASSHGRRPMWKWSWQIR